MINSFKFFSDNKIHKRFSYHPDCTYEDARRLLDALIVTGEYETTIFPKEYPAEHGIWKVVYINYRDNSFHSVITYIPNNPYYLTESFLINIDY